MKVKDTVIIEDSTTIALNGPDLKFNIFTNNPRNY